MESRTYSKIIIVVAFFAISILAPHAEASTFFQVSTSTFGFNTALSLDQTPNNDPKFTVYKGEYPATTTVVVDLINAGGGVYNFSLRTLIEANAPGKCVVNTSTNFTCDMEQFIQTDGTYWLQFKTSTNNFLEQWYAMTRSNGIWSINNTILPTFSIASGSYTTRFLNAVVTASTTNPKDFHIDLTYYLNPAEINRSVSSLNPTQVLLSWAISPSTAYSKLGYDIASTTGTSTYRINVPDADWPDNGVINAVVSFSNGGCFLGLSDCPFPKSYLYLTFTMTNKAVTGSTTVENYNSLNVTVNTQECSISNFAGCINNSLIYLFVPSDTVLNQFIDIRTRLDTIKPFGYLTMALTALGNVNASGTPAYNMPTIPFASAIFNPLKTGMSLILWAMFIFVFYEKRIKKINI